MGAPVTLTKAEKLRRGTFRVDRDDPQRAVLRPDIPVPPRGLRGAPRRIYDDLAPILIAANLLTKADHGSFVRLCYYQALVVKLLRMKVTPESLRTIFTLEDKIKTLEDRFGMNPASRCRIAVPKVDDATKNPEDFS